MCNYLMVYFAPALCSLCFLRIPIKSLFTYIKSIMYVHFAQYFKQIFTHYRNYAKYTKLFCLKTIFQLRSLLTAQQMSCKLFIHYSGFISPPQYKLFTITFFQSNEKTIVLMIRITFTSSFCSVCRFTFLRVLKVHPPKSFKRRLVRVSHGHVPLELCVKQP